MEYEENPDLSLGIDIYSTCEREGCLCAKIYIVDKNDETVDILDLSKEQIMVLNGTIMKLAEQLSMVARINDQVDGFISN